MKNLLLFLLYNISYLLSAQVSHSFSKVSLINGPFYHGVASGDPLSDRVIIWTRLTTADSVAQVSWEISEDPSFTSLSNFGNSYTSQQQDFTVKIDVPNLSPNTWYYYRFQYNGDYSSIGRTKTTPIGDTDSLRFGVVSCAKYVDGYFNAYHSLALRNDIDAVIHLGDYIYEHGESSNIPGDTVHDSKPGHEIISLEDYRLRFSQYHLDTSLQLLHQFYPFIVVWDDHESANDSWKGGAQNHTPSSEGNWDDRKSYSKQAFFEWLPIRDVYNSNDTIRRTIKYGDLVDFIMLDTRLEGRDQQINVFSTGINDPNRSLLGSTQLQWFKNQLSNSTSQWKLIGNQVMIAPLKVSGLIVNDDQWDDYPAERKRVLDYIMQQNIDNVVFITGDLHSSWSSDVPHPDSSYQSSTGKGSAATEFVCTSITSISTTFNTPISLIKSFNPHIKYAKYSKRGYLIMDVNKARVQGDHIEVSTSLNTNYTSTLGSSWINRDGNRFLEENNLPLAPRPNFPPLYPLLTKAKNNPKQDVLITCFPNPFAEEINIQYYANKATSIKLTIQDLLGNQLYQQSLFISEKGLQEFRVPMPSLPKGSYIVLIDNGSESIISKKIVKN
jgi:alkaline phosphatase D